jgi:hypothetical protein
VLWLFQIGAYAFCPGQLQNTIILPVPPA